MAAGQSGHWSRSAYHERGGQDRRTDRRHRRRARRAGGGLHAGGPRPRGRRSSRSNAWLGGKAAVLEEGGFRFDMGPTILTMPRVLRRIFAEAGRDLERPPRPRPPRPAVALLLRRRLGPRPASTTSTHGGRRSTRFAPGRRRRGLRRLPRPLRAAARLSDALLLLEVGRAASGDMIDFRPNISASTLRDVLACAWARRSPARCGSTCPTPRVAQMLDHFTQYVGSSPTARRRCCAASPTCRPARASGTRGAAPAPCPRRWRSWPRNSASSSAPAPACAASSPTAARRRRRDRRRRADRARGRGLERRRRAHPPRTGRRRRRRQRFERRRGYEPACSGVVLYLGLDRAYDHLLHHNFVFSRDPEEEFDCDLPQGRAGARPDLLPRRPGPHRTRRRARPAARRSTSSFTRPTCARTTTGGGCCPAYRRVDPRQAEADRRACRTSRSGSSSSAALTPQDIHDRYRVLNGAIYGLASHGRLLGAFKPANRCRGRAGPLPRGRRGAPGPGHADGADVRLDRRRHARPDVAGAGASRRPGGCSRRPAGASSP